MNDFWPENTIVKCGCGKILSSNRVERIYWEKDGKVDIRVCRECYGTSKERVS